MSTGASHWSISGLSAEFGLMIMEARGGEQTFIKKVWRSGNTRTTGVNESVIHRSQGWIGQWGAVSFDMINQQPAGDRMRNCNTNREALPRLSTRPVLSRSDHGHPHSSCVYGSNMREKLNVSFHPQPMLLQQTCLVTAFWWHRDLSASVRQSKPAAACVKALEMLFVV